MKRKLTRNEQYEADYTRFVNNYKWKTKDEIIRATAEIKSSNISEFKYILLGCLRVGDMSNIGGSKLAIMQDVLRKLISQDSPAKEYLNERLKIVQDALEKS